MTFAVLKTSYTWRPIRNCPGRYTLVQNDLSFFNEFYASLRDITIHSSSAVADQVHIYRLDDGGLISYHRDDGSFVHTLNDQSGFERMLKDLELDYLL